LISSNSSYGVSHMVFNATFTNVSGISWWSVLLVEETGVSDITQPTSRNTLTNFTTTCYIKYTLTCAGLEVTTVVVICTDFIGIHKLTNDHDHDGPDLNFVMRCTRYNAYKKCFGDLGHVFGFLHLHWFPPPILLTTTIAMK